jgi:hypothetical protein
VKPVWAAFDDRQFANQPAVEALALKLYEKNPAEAVEFLTTCSNALAQEALTIGQNMLTNLFTRFALVNNPQTSRGYEDPKTWKGSGVIY